MKNYGLINETGAFDLEAFNRYMDVALVKKDQNINQKERIDFEICKDDKLLHSYLQDIKDEVEYSVYESAVILCPKADIRNWKIQVRSDIYKYDKNVRY